MKKDQEKHNPCLKEQMLTYKCLDSTGYDKEKCDMQINNYNLCKSFWGQIKSQRRKQGITPYLPVPEDREKIKAEYFDHYAKTVN